jgi:hypothetical protein
VLFNEGETARVSTTSANPGEPEALRDAPPTGRTGRVIAWSSFVFALLQSLCTFFAAANGLRFAIGIGALVVGASVGQFIDWFHSDLIRLPMVGLALFGSMLNLLVLWQVRRLRARPAAAWRVRPVSARKMRMEWVQFGLSVVTLVLIAVEEYWHLKWHHRV